MQELFTKARKEFPYSDEEVEELYCEAVGRPEAPPPFRQLVLDVFGPSVCLGLLSLVIFGAATESSLLSAFLWPFIPAFILLLIANLQKISLHLGPRLPGVDVYSPEVLATVAKYVSRQPILQAESLQRSISKSRVKIALSLELLPTIIDHLQSELDQAVDSSIRLLLESKHAAARDAQTRLWEVDEALVVQSSEADRAVAPVTKMVEKMDRIAAISDSLEAIQAAHGLVIEAEAEVEHHAVELQILHAVTAGAMAKLDDIQARFNADASARVELQETIKEDERQEQRLNS